MEILIIKLGAIGDVIRTTSILPGLKEKYKNCSIGWVTKKESYYILKNNKLIDNMYLISEINREKNSLNKNFFLKEYDLIINLDDDYEASELISKLNYKKVIGAYLANNNYLANNQLVYTKDSSLWFDMGLISIFGKQKADVLKAKNKRTYQEIMYKILGLEYRKQEPILMLNEEELNFGKKFSQKNDIKLSNLVIGINTGAGGRWQDKKLSIEKTAELINKLGKFHNMNKIDYIKLILFGGPEERERNKKIIQLVKTNKVIGKVIDNIIDAGCDNSLMEFASLVNLCNILVTSDSLALHIGTALKKKIIVFFGPTSSSEIELYSRGIKIIPKKGCLCCYKQRCDVPIEYEVNEIVKAIESSIES